MLLSLPALLGQPVSHSVSQSVNRSVFSMHPSFQYSVEEIVRFLLMYVEDAEHFSMLESMCDGCNNLHTQPGNLHRHVGSGCGQRACLTCTLRKPLKAVHSCNRPPMRCASGVGIYLISSGCKFGNIFIYPALWAPYLQATLCSLHLQAANLFELCSSCTKTCGA